MRTLNKRQKNYLESLFHEQGIRDVDDLSTQEWKKLERMNDHETLHQNANRFLWDLQFANNPNMYFANGGF